MNTLQKSVDRVLFWLFASTVTVLPLLFVPWADGVFEEPKVLFFRLVVLLVTILTVLRASLQRQRREVWRGAWRWVWRSRWSWSWVWRGRWQKILVPLAVFVIAATVSTILSDVPMASFLGSHERLQGLFQIFFYAVFSVDAFLFFKDKNEELGEEFGAERFLRFLCLGIVLVSSLAVIQKLSGQVSYRVFSTLGHPNFLGTYLLLGIPFLFMFVKKADSAQMRFCWRVTLFLAIGSLFLTFSRAAVLGLFLELLLIPKKGLSKEILAVFCALCLFVSGSFLANDKSALSRISGRGEGETSVEIRFDIWQFAAKRILEKPFFGHGSETFQYTVNYGDHDIASADRAHNEVLDLLFNFGIFGSLALLWLFGSIFVTGFKKRSSAIVVACMIGAIGLFCANMFGFSTTVHYVILCILSVFIVTEN